MFLAVYLFVPVIGLLEILITSLYKSLLAGAGPRLLKTLILYVCPDYGATYHYILEN